MVYASWQRRGHSITVSNLNRPQTCTDRNLSVAVRRYAEGASQIVFHDLLLDVQGGSDLEQKLREQVGVVGTGAAQRCRTFVEPSEETIRERNDLRRKKELLRTLMNRLSQF